MRKQNLVHWTDIHAITRGKMVVKCLEFGFSHKQTLRQDLSAKNLSGQWISGAAGRAEEEMGMGRSPLEQVLRKRECSWRWGSSFWGFRAGDLQEPAGHVSGLSFWGVRKLGHFSRLLPSFHGQELFLGLFTHWHLLYLLLSASTLGHSPRCWGWTRAHPWVLSSWVEH